MIALAISAAISAPLAPPSTERRAGEWFGVKLCKPSSSSDRKASGDHERPAPAEAYNCGGREVAEEVFDGRLLLSEVERLCGVHP